MRSMIRLAVLFLFASAACLACAQESTKAASTVSPKLERLPQPLEVHLALAAAPPHLRSEATVYVLDPAKGYVLERKGSNGFTCYVQRTDYTRQQFDNDFIVPECQDPEGSRTIAPVEFDVERLRAEGKLTPAELKQEIDRRFKNGVYHSPARPGIAYMLSPLARLYPPGSKGAVFVNMPHYMFFAPNLKATDIGAAPPMGPYPFLINPGPMAYIILTVGESEKAQLNRDSQDLFKEACDNRADLCMDGMKASR